MTTTSPQEPPLTIIQPPLEPAHHAVLGAASAPATPLRRYHYLQSAPPRSPTRSTWSTFVTGNQSIYRSGVLLVTYNSYCSVTCYRNTTGITAIPNSEGPMTLLLEYVGPGHRLRHLPRGPPILMVFPQCCSAPAEQARGRACLSRTSRNHLMLRFSPP